MMNCATCIERLHAFLDGELDDPESEQVQHHLDGCAPCFGRSEVEEAFRRSLQDLAAAAPPSPELEERVRGALQEEYAREDEAATFAKSEEEPAAAAQPTQAGLGLRRWLSRGLAAAAVLIAVLVGRDLMLETSLHGPDPAEHPVSVTGTLVCVDCLMAARRVPSSGLDLHLPQPEVPSKDLKAHHDLHLQLTDGSIWQLRSRPTTQPDLVGHANVGRSATILGTSYPDLRVLRVTRASLN